MSMELYSKFEAGAKIWVPHCNSVWIGGVILEYVPSARVMKILKDDGEITEIKLPSAKAGNVEKLKYPFLRNPDILIGQNDLTSLSYLNEPEVLYNLQIRFCDRKEIYTYCGIVLVAINPYQDIPIYDFSIIDAYHSGKSGDLDPHIYAVAENAFRQMADFDENQSIIVSGESGAGKTVSAKYTMRYFATVGGSSNETIPSSVNQRGKRRSRHSLVSPLDKGETQIERKVLSSNPVMEAMGNAKTIRNDNSSRFGKYLEIQFGVTNQIEGAYMDTYLLEKSRVVNQNFGERNYHIFYQLVRSSDSYDDLFANTELTSDPNDYNYLNRGGSIDIDTLNDAMEFNITKTSFLHLNIREEQLKLMIEILSAILHLGNIVFVPDESSEGSRIENDKYLLTASRLLGISADSLIEWLCNRSISTVHETLVKPLSVDEANYFRDAMSKYIYSALFQWVVKNINTSLKGTFNGGKNSKNQNIKQKFIGVLDIYGFETFEENSFEQFCINFANEKLQQQFTLHVFKLEQEEYKKEGLQWDFIDFYNNQLCIDLIESKLGLLDLLDEECRLINGSDDNWCKKIYSRYLKSSMQHFSKPKLGESAFIIEHFAGSVQYESQGFIEKNRDSVLEEHVTLLKSSTISLFCQMLSASDENVNDVENSREKSSRSTTPTNLVTFNDRKVLDNKHNVSRKMKRTVASQFRNSLRELMANLNRTTPHYVRCIKPNDEKLPFTFCPQRAVQQLRACGVLETIRLSAAGFPSRWTYSEFYQRYYLLLSQFKLDKKSVKDSCKCIVQTLIKTDDFYRFGHSKLFFRSGQVAFLEKRRGEKLYWAATFIQKQVKGKYLRKKFLLLRNSTIIVQSIIRQKMAINKMNQLRRDRAVLRIQTYYRMYRNRKMYCNIQKSTLIIQRWWKLSKLRKLEYMAKKTKYIIVCQSLVRCFICFRRYKKILRGFILLQCHFRRRKAKEVLKKLKIEARSVTHIRSINKGLEIKIIEITQKLNEKEKEIVLNKTNYEKQKRSCLDQCKIDTREMEKNYTLQIEELKFENAKLQRELKKEISEKDRIMAEMEVLKKDFKEKQVDSESYMSALLSERESLRDIIHFKDEEIETLQANQKKKFDISQSDCTIDQYMELEKRYRETVSELNYLKDHIVGSQQVGVKMAGDVLPYLENKDDKEGLNLEGLDLITYLQSHSRSISGENQILHDRVIQLEAQLIDRTTDNEDASFCCMHDHNHDNTDMFQELQLLIKQIKESGYEGAEEVLLDKIVDMKNQINFLKDKNQKLQTDMISERLGKLGDKIENNGLIFNTDVEELKLVLASQKKANRNLLEELEELKTAYKINQKEVSSLRSEKENLLNQINIQHEKINKGIEYVVNLQNKQFSREERLSRQVETELKRVLKENLRLQYQSDQTAAKVSQLKRALKYFARRLEKHEGAAVPDMSSSKNLVRYVDENIVANRLKSFTNECCITKMGMIDLKMGEINIFVETYVRDLTPRKCYHLKPYHLPAFIFFMISKKFDFFEEEKKIIDFNVKIVGEIRKIVKKKDDFNIRLMWFSHVVCLTNLFRQYSKETSLNSDVSDTLKNVSSFSFDVTLLTDQLDIFCQFIYETIFQHVTENLIVKSHCISAFLENEELYDYKPKLTPYASFINILDVILSDMKRQHLPIELIYCFFNHLSRLINAYCVNELLLNTKLCTFHKGIQIGYNISSFETWLHNKQLKDSDALECLQPLRDIVRLLQITVESECIVTGENKSDFCHSLSVNQILKIMRNFNSRDADGSCKLSADKIAQLEQQLLLGQEVHSNSRRRSIYNEAENLLIPVPHNSYCDSVAETISDLSQCPPATGGCHKIPYVTNEQSLTTLIIPSHLLMPCLTVLTESAVSGKVSK